MVKKQSKSFLSKFKKFVRTHSRRRRTRRKHRAKGPGRRHRSSRLRHVALGRKKTKTPTSLSVFPDKSPQLQKKGEPTKLNPFTSKNIAIRDSKGREFNAIINGRLAYRRAPRGHNVHNLSPVIYGPRAEQLTKQNYKKLKRGTMLYYDRGSVVLRGPLKFQNVVRGPKLLMKVSDTVYPVEYLFTMAVDRLGNEKLYMVVDKKRTDTRRKKKRRRRSSRK